MLKERETAGATETEERIGLRSLEKSAEAVARLRASEEAISECVCVCVCLNCYVLAHVHFV